MRHFNPDGDGMGPSLPTDAEKIAAYEAISELVGLRYTEFPQRVVERVKKWTADAQPVEAGWQDIPVVKAGDNGLCVDFTWSSRPMRICMDCKQSVNRYAHTKCPHCEHRFDYVTSQCQTPENRAVLAEWYPNLPWRTVAFAS